MGCCRRRQIIVEYELLHPLLLGGGSYSRLLFLGC